VTRDDLLALDEAKLAALATRGHVKRAAKLLARGRGPSLRVEPDGTVVSTLGEHTTRLVPGAPLRDTECSCSALKVCGHRVIAVLAYRAQRDGQGAPAPPAAWSPATLDDAAIEELLGRHAMTRARRRRTRGYVAEIHRGEIPSVELATCTVRFLVAGEPSYARCDCEQGVKCAHLALAVWAFREADARDPDSAQLTVEVGGGGFSLEALDPARALAAGVLLDGAAGAGEGLAARFARAAKPLDDARLRWPVTLVDDLRETLARYAGRDAAYDPGRVGALLTELHGRATAAARGGAVPPRAVLGADEPEQTALEHLRLVSLGCRLSREPEGGAYRARVDVFLADPDASTVLVLRRAWSTGPDEAGPALSRRNLAPDVPLGGLAAGQMVTRAAKRRANRQLVLGRGGLARTSVTPQRGDWGALFRAPLYVEGFAALATELRERPPWCVRPRLLADSVRVLAIHDVGSVAYHAGDQTLRADVHDAAGARVRVELAHSPAAPGALDALAAALADRPRYLSGEVRAGDAPVLTPLAVVTDRVIALDVEPASRHRLPAGDVGASSDPVHAALAATRDVLDRGAHAGLRRVTERWREELTRAAARLEVVGLGGCARRARAVDAGLARSAGGDEEALVAAWLSASLRVRLALEAL